MPDCPNCGNDELYSLAAATWQDGKDAYFTAGVACYACNYRSDNPPAWWQTEPGVFWIRVDDMLQRTPLGYHLAWQKIPRFVRGTQPYRVGIERRIGAYRWWEFRS